jgi:hypothetical protein
VTRAAATLAILVACNSGRTPFTGGHPDGPPGDAQLSACGLPEPGSRCKTANTIEMCAGTEIVTVDCDGATLCGADPSSSSSAACVTPAQSCGGITARGACSGDVFTACANGKLALLDCSAMFGTCVYDATQNTSGCTSECKTRGVTAEGQCTTNGLQRCDFSDGAFRVIDVECPSGMACGTSPDSRQVACLPTKCGDLGAVGHCDGDTLVRCTSDGVANTPCGDGTVCAYGGADGYACIPSGQAGARRVTGVVRYEDRPLVAKGLGPHTPTPARGIAVAVVNDSDRAALAVAATDDAGGYTLRYDAPDGASVHVLAIAQSVAPGRPARVVRADGTLHGFPGASFTGEQADGADVLVTESSGAAEAFNILDVTANALDELRADLGLTDVRPVDFIWYKGKDATSNTVDNVIALQGRFDDDDGYDDSVIAHELGHYVEDSYGRTDNPGLQHFLNQPELPTLAWSEGWASYYSSVVRKTPVYFDSNALGGFGFNIDKDVTTFTGRSMTDGISENTVSEILWDLGDDGTGDDDPVPGPHRTVVVVEPNYLAGLTTDRGFNGVDLVDFLDGYLVLNGASTCAGLHTVLMSRSFPYDFGGPVPCSR